MPLYMIQARFTSEAWEALYTSDVDRREVISKMLSESGGRLIDYYFSFGDSDVIVVTEAPDNITAASAVIAVARSGAVTDVVTTVLMSYEDGIAALNSSGAMEYQPPAT
ncbi:GYD domain-containing protein [Candidatus Lucifugimonas marina]|uniref:GYD domain-containing protein n=1 Tax=Candidatus Lucifugimonas marina TaxID=3038979 RepID=A0AAJ5ZKN4_9CHLR|nr:GYD domain-containing protein [SAR202 cluster bacterium JH702]MDG0870461.1 GYD domain-containing protein [SAR202 cluster bacterium JH639]WFG35989.1 GYD domain-containing protein [SAR202 cluster bacterium JH545]WFG39933.1 GYD domain-containing protein [SAR202 cluster bacterium JH1073]